MKKISQFEIFGISSDYEVTDQKVLNGELVLECRPANPQEICPKCGSQEIMKKGKRVKRLMTVPVGNEACWIDVTIPKRLCKTCAHRYELLPGFAPKHRRSTYVMMEYVQRLAQLMSLSDVAVLTGMGWDMVKDIVKERLERVYSRPDLSDLEYISIDEIYSGKKKVLHADY